MLLPKVQYEKWREADSHEGVARSFWKTWDPEKVFWHFVSPISLLAHLVHLGFQIAEAEKNHLFSSWWLSEAATKVVFFLTNNKQIFLEEKLWHGVVCSSTCSLSSRRLTPFILSSPTCTKGSQAIFSQQLATQLLYT
jgi:hypothetical protein